ncbi:MAG TPA: chemotaxis protein CheB [Myxococcales bacterium]|jgi:two-component system chemotaxis response regulator CheB
MGAPLRIVVVDDSAVLVEALTAALEEEGDFKVVGTASNGRDAVPLVERLRPDLVTMDAQMPVMDGLDAVERIMARTPTRIVIITSEPKGRGGELVFDALARGALEVIAKQPLQEGSEEARALRERLRLLVRVPLRSRAPRVVLARTGARGGPGAPSGVIGVVASTGGPALLEALIASLPADFPAALLVVQHIAEGFTPKLANWLARSCALDVRVARGAGERLERGVVLFAADGAHLLVDAGVGVRVDPSGAFHEGHKPSGSVLLSSIAKHYGRRGGGLVLTGMGRDGCDGLIELKQAGGWTAAQDSASAAVDGMPRAARESGAAAEVLTPAEFPGALLRIATRWENQA